MQREKAVLKLHTSAKASKRINVLKKIVKIDEKAGGIAKRTNAQINTSTIYSFSPYTPTEAVYMAYNAGMPVCGISDTDSAAGMKEFVKAAKICGLSYTLGCRTHAVIGGKRVGIMIYGIAEDQIPALEALLANNREQSRQAAEMRCKELNRLLKTKYTYKLDFNKIKDETEYKRGGTVTQRHVYYAFAKLLCAKIEKGEKMIECIRSLGFEPREKSMPVLLAKDNPYYEYDLAREMSYNAGHEKEKYTDFAQLNKEIKVLGGFCAFIAKERELADAEGFAESLKKTGFDAVCADTSCANLDAFNAACIKRNMLLLPWNHIDSPRKKFLMQEGMVHIMENVWALVGNELALNTNNEDGIFSETVRESRFEEKIKLFATIGKNGSKEQ